MHASCEPVPVPIVEWSAFAQPYIPTAMHIVLYREWYEWTEFGYAKQEAIIRYAEVVPELNTWFETGTLALKTESILDTMHDHDAASSRDSMRQTLVMASKDYLGVVERSYRQHPEDWQVALRQGTTELRQGITSVGDISASSS